MLRGPLRFPYMRFRRLLWDIELQLFGIPSHCPMGHYWVKVKPVYRQYRDGSCRARLMLTCSDITAHGDTGGFYQRLKWVGAPMSEVV